MKGKTKYIVTGQMAAFKDGVKKKGYIIDVKTTSRGDLQRNIKLGLIKIYKDPKKVDTDK